MNARLQLRLLGTFDARLDGVPLQRFRSTKVRALLAYLAVEADRPHRREGLANLSMCACHHAADGADRRHIRQGHAKGIHCRLRLFETGAGGGDLFTAIAAPHQTKFLLCRPMT